VNSPSIRLFASHREVLNYLSTCEKRALIGDPEQLNAFQKFSQQNYFKLGLGKDRFLPRTYYWFIPNGCGKFLPRRLSLIFSSGIYDKWESIFYSRTRDELDPSLKTEIVEDKQKLESHLGHFFFIYLACVIIGAIVFIMELIWGIVKSQIHNFESK